MINVSPGAWTVILDHLKAAYPKEGCGLLLGAEGAAGGAREVTVALPSTNVYEGDQKDRFLVDPRVQIQAMKIEREQGLAVLGVFHSHPDEDAYFSTTDRENTWSFYSNIVVSIRGREFAGAKCFRVNEDRTEAFPEDLSFDKSR